jgi:hypothetical protein
VRPWKLLGLAGLAGVAATGAVLVRNERQRRAYTPDDVRVRLHARHEEAAEESSAPPEAPVSNVTELRPRRRGRFARLLRRRR